MPKAVFAAGLLILFVGVGVGYYAFTPSYSASVNAQASEMAASVADASANPSQAAINLPPAPDNSLTAGVPQPPAQPQATAAVPQGTMAPPSSTNLDKVMQATLHTNKGDITIEFDPQLSPTSVKNFIDLASKGFYDSTKFHRVIKDFMIQGGDPLSKDDSKVAQWGTGGPGYQFNDEITPNSHNSLGTVAMANSGPNTNGSQFYINAKDNNFLDGKYVVFGHVTAGMDVVMAIDGVQTDSNDRPVDPVIVQSVALK